MPLGRNLEEVECYGFAQELHQDFVGFQHVDDHLEHCLASLDSMVARSAKDL